MKNDAITPETSKRTARLRRGHDRNTPFVLCISVQAAATSTRVLEAMTGIDEMRAP